MTNLLDEIERGPQPWTSGFGLHHESPQAFATRIALIALEEAARICDGVWKQDEGTAGAGSSAACAIAIRAFAATLTPGTGNPSASVESVDKPAPGSHAERRKGDIRPADAWLVERSDGTKEVVLSPLTDATFMDEGDEVWALYKADRRAPSEPAHTCRGERRVEQRRKKQVVGAPYNRYRDRRQSQISTTGMGRSLKWVDR